jgi:UDP-N-acetylglucosamine diphosphorylase / glucose-1-phosphate thymidylyltransferase / UDP-N-acetylgalactosamine diphosphorylase / glucosamine-1-phosphate N-acetyltransferase / galactosamine-1-phosphate N-acetyltransferase
MRLILLDRSADHRQNFFPLALSRPLWELRCGMTSLGEKLQAKVGVSDVAYFLPDYMAEVYRARTDRPVNDVSTLTDDILIVDARVKADSFALPSRSEAGIDEQGQILYVRVTAGDSKKLQGGDLSAFLESAKAALPNVRCSLPTWNYTWDLILASPHQITADFAVAGRSGIEGIIEEPSAIRGSRNDVYVAPGARIHPMVVLDAEHGPIYIDEDVEVHPFTRIEGPCFIGKKSILLGAKCREGNSIGPWCRVGGEVEESIIQGYSNKYHDGFLGHAYVGEWVNLGALTTNSDLKNDYSTVEVMLDGKHCIDTGSTKVGSLIGDHTKTSIGVLFNTGSVVGAMAIIMATGKPLPKFIPSFAWFIEGVVTKGFGRKILYETAATAMSRRKCQWTEADRALWDAIFEMTAGPRGEAVKKGRKAMMK